MLKEHIARSLDGDGLQPSGRNEHIAKR